MAYFECVIGGGGTSLTIQITTSSTALYGQTITISKDGSTVGTTAFDNTGSAEYTVRESGTYTVSVTMSGVTFSDTVEVTDTFDATIEATPDGSTVTPVNDIQIWLHCGNVWNKNYTTLSEVLADTTTLLALINSQNAVDYMVRSHDWCDDVCADATAMTYIGANDYAADTLLADDNPGLVPTMTSDTTPSGKSSASSVNAISQYTFPAWVAFGGFDMSATTSGNYGTAWQATGNVNEWLEYEFPSATRITMMMFRGLKNTGENYGRVKTYKVQGYDGSSWVDLTENLICPNTNDGSLPCTPLQKAVFTKNIGDYSKFRIDVIDNYANSADYKIAIKYLQFYAKDGSWLESICNSTYFESVLNVKVPTMTSNTTPSGECIRSSAYNAQWEAWKAFDGVSDRNNGWQAGQGQGGAQYVGYVFESAVKIYKANIYVSDNTALGRIGANATIKASNDDGTTWKDLTDILSGFIVGQNYFVMSKNIGLYKHYKFNMPSTTASVYIGELQFYGRASA